MTVILSQPVYSRPPPLKQNQGEIRRRLYTDYQLFLFYLRRTRPWFNIPHSCGFYAFLLHKEVNRFTSGLNFKIIDILSQTKAGTTRTLTTAIRDWLVCLSFREKLKIESHKTSLLGVECIPCHFAFVPEAIMDLATLFYNLREEVSCSLCSDLFTDPKSLSCLHHFCFKCLERWYEGCDGGDTIKCPKCQTLSRVPKSGDLKDLPTSFYLNGLTDVLAIKECNKSQVTCGNCDKKCSEASYCFQCCKFYCESCLKCHNTMRDKKEHRVLALKEFQDKDYVDVLKRPIFCLKQDHQKAELKHYCRECEASLCQTCFVLDHTGCTGHVSTSIEEEAESQKLEVKSVLQTKREGLSAKLNIIAQLDKDCAKVIQESELLKKDVQRFADDMIGKIKAKKKNIIDMVENKTKKSLESLTMTKSELQQQVDVIKSSLEQAEKLLQLSTTADVVQLKKALQTIFQLVDHTEPIVHDQSCIQTFVFGENRKLFDIVNEEEIGSLEEAHTTKANESLAKGEGLKEGTVGRKAQFEVITRNAARKQCYDERDSVTVEIKDEQERECATELQVEDIKDGTYKISYYPRVQGTFKLLVKVNGESISGNPFFTVIARPPFHVQPVSSFGNKGERDGMFQNPEGIAVNDRDEIIVVDTHNHRVQVFDSKGTFLRSFGCKGKNPGEFSHPYGIAIGNNGNIFISEWDNHRVQIFSCEERHLGSFGDKGSHDSRLLNPRGLSLDSNGNVIVADKGNKEIKVFTPDGSFVMKIGGQRCFRFPAHCVQCGEYLIVSDSFENCIKVFNRDGHLQYKFGKQGEGDGEFKLPAFLSVTQSKQLLVCDRGNDRIQILELDGTFVGKFGTKGSNLGEFNQPTSVAVLSNDQIVVCDANNQIQIFQHI